MIRLFFITVVFSNTFLLLLFSVIRFFLIVAVVSIDQFCFLLSMLFSQRGNLGLLDLGINHSTMAKPVGPQSLH